MSASESDSSTEVCNEKHYRRRRTIITPDQLSKLEAAFKIDPWPSRSKKEQIAAELGKNEIFVSTWFQNKRARVRRTEELHLPKPSALPLKDDNVNLIKTVTIEDKGGNKYLKIVRVSPSDAFGDISKKVHKQVMVDTQTSNAGGSHVRKLVMQAEPLEAPREFANVDPAVGHCSKAHTAIKANVHELDQVKEYPSLTGGVGSGSSMKSPMMGTSTQNKVKSNHECTQPQSPVLLPNGQEKRASDVPKPPSLFYSIIDMMAMAEGGIISASDPEYGPAVSNALYGILINERSRITYDKVLGLEIQDFEELAAIDS